MRERTAYDESADAWLREWRFAYLKDTSALRTNVARPSAACPGRDRYTLTFYQEFTQWVTSVTEIGYAPADCDTPVWFSTRYRDFNAWGQPRRVDGPLPAGDMLRIAYYECETGGACGQIQSITNDLGHTTRFESFDAHGRLTRMVDANGLETTWTYTLRGRPATITRRHAGESRTTAYVYDAAGQIDRVTLPDGEVLDYTWNAAHLLESIEDAAGSRIEFHYDARGLRDGEVVRDAAGTLRRSLSLLHDAQGRPIAVQQGNAAATAYVPDAVGNVVAEIDPNGNESAYAYDELNRLTWAIDALNGPGHPTLREYDAHDNVRAVTAGMPRKPGMDRSDLLEVNGKIVNTVADYIREGSPESRVVAVTNPLDTMVYLLAERLGFEKNRVVGMAGVLDSARMSFFISEQMGGGIADTRCMVLGGHGDSMVPMPSFSTVNGVSITALMSQETIEAINDRTKHGGAEIVNLLKTGSAYYAPASAAVAMAKAILRDEHRLMPAAAYLNGQYGLSDIYMGVPVVLGARGVERVVELELEEDGAAALQKSADAIRRDLNLLRERELLAV